MLKISPADLDKVKESIVMIKLNLALRYYLINKGVLYMDNKFNFYQLCDCVIISTFTVKNFIVNKMQNVLIIYTEIFHSFRSLPILVITFTAIT